MIIRVNVLIYIYIALCLCILLFDLFYAARKRWRRGAEPKRTQKYRATLVALLDADSMLFSPRELKAWKKRLSNVSDLICFHEAVEGLLNDRPHHKAMALWIQQNKALFWALSQRYLKKDDLLFASFFSYLLWQYHLCAEPESTRFVVLAQELCLLPSLYCRENALCALYASGQPHHVVKAYLLLSQHGTEHSAKLVTDGLLQFSGDKNELAQQLWQSWSEFPPYYQVCFINFIRMVSGEFQEHFLSLVQDGVNNEVQFAALRYFRTYPDPRAVHLLQQLVTNWNRDDWEFAAIAASSLEKYPSPSTARALWAGCHSTNWHVRENAADSLMQIANDATLQKMIAREQDKYAREMLSYKLMKRMCEQTK